MAPPIFEWIDGQGTHPCAGKKIGPSRAKGRVKRSLLINGHALPQAVVIAGAHRHDSMLLEKRSRISLSNGRRCHARGCASIVAMSDAASMTISDRSA